MSLIQGIRKNLLYFSITIPLVLIGYEFLMFSTTANRGWLFLFIGQVLIVPIIYTIFSLLFRNFFNNSSRNMIIGLVVATIVAIIFGFVIPVAVEAAKK